MAAKTAFTQEALFFFSSPRKTTDVVCNALVSLVSMTSVTKSFKILRADALVRASCSYTGVGWFLPYFARFDLDRFELEDSRAILSRLEPKEASQLYCQLMQLYSQDLRTIKLGLLSVARWSNCSAGRHVGQN